jgi:hypothetical protein
LGAAGGTGLARHGRTSLGSARNAE